MEKKEGDIIKIRILNTLRNILIVWALYLVFFKIDSNFSWPSFFGFIISGLLFQIYNMKRKQRPSDTKVAYISVIFFSLVILIYYFVSYIK